MPDFTPLERYVLAALALHRVTLEPEPVKRVTDTFAATAALAAPLLERQAPAQGGDVPAFWAQGADDAR